MCTLPSLRILMMSRFFLSGQTTHVVELGLEARRQGHAVMIASTGSSHPEAWHEYGSVLRNAHIPSVDYRSLRQLMRHVDAFAPEIIHVHSSDLIQQAVEVGQVRRIPVVATCHGLTATDQRAGIQQLTRVIAVGHRVQQHLNQMGLSAITVISNGIDTDKFKPRTEENTLTSTSPLRVFNVTYVGRMDRTKKPGLSALVQAISQIPRVHLHLAANVRIDHPNVTSYGWLTDPSSLMQQSDVVVGTGRAIREGMACGAVAMILGEMYGGIVVPDKVERKDSISFDFSGKHGVKPAADVLRPALVRLIQNESRTKEIKEKSRLLAEECFSIRRIFGHTVHLYRATICQEDDKGRQT